MSGYPDETLSLVFDILLEAQVSIREVLVLSNNTVIIKDLEVGVHTRGIHYTLNSIPKS